MTVEEQKKEEVVWNEKCCRAAAVIVHFFWQVEYKKDLENTKGHSINFCETPQFQNAAKVAKFTSDVSVTTSKIFYMHKSPYKTVKERN